jgi:hypothetical protein
MATAESFGVGPFKPDKAQARVTYHTVERMRDVQALIDEGESQANIARFIAGQEDLTPGERVLARIVLHRHGLARSSQGGSGHV